MARPSWSRVRRREERDERERGGEETRFPRPASCSLAPLASTHSFLFFFITTQRTTPASPSGSTSRPCPGSRPCGWRPCAPRWRRGGEAWVKRQEARERGEARLRVTAGVLFFLPSLFISPSVKHTPTNTHHGLARPAVQKPAGAAVRAWGRGGRGGTVPLSCTPIDAPHLFLHSPLPPPHQPKHSIHLCQTSPASQGTRCVGERGGDGAGQQKESERERQKATATARRPRSPLAHAPRTLRAAHPGA